MATTQRELGAPAPNHRRKYVAVVVVSLVVAIAAVIVVVGDVPGRIIRALGGTHEQLFSSRGLTRNWTSCAHILATYRCGEWM